MTADDSLYEEQKEEQPMMAEPKEEKKTEKEIKNEQIDKAKEEGNKVLNKLREINYSELISTCYTEMDAYIDMTARKISNGCIIEGSAGTGKTYRALARCKNLDFAYLDSFTTPQALYIWLYLNRDKDIVVIDDVAGFFKNDKVLAFLKGGLWAIEKDNKGKPSLNYCTRT
jgi:hypothetical protein